jgi:hypothetical protein
MSCRISRAVTLWVAPLLDAVAETIGLLTGAPDAFMSEVARRFLRPIWMQKTFPAKPKSIAQLHGIYLRYRRVAECRQIDPVQRSHRDRCGRRVNYPFCTIEPNIGRVAVPDKRLAICATRKISRDRSTAARIR